MIVGVNHPDTITPFFISMPNQRQSGTKLAGAYISAEKDEALARLAVEKGYTNKAEYIRALYDAALHEATAKVAEQPAPPLKRSPKKPRSAAKAKK